jgi:TolA-binding protein
MLKLGTALINTGDLEQAVDVLQRSIDQYPDQPTLAEAFLRLGYALATQGKCEQAIPVLGRAVAGGEAVIAAEAQFRIGECHAELGRRDRAIVEYLKVVYLYPNQPSLVARAQFRAANIYEEIGKEEEAMKLYQKLIATAQDAALVEQAQQRVTDLNQELPRPQE